MQAATQHLPKVLCLHGGGTSADIFELQTYKLRYKLQNHFDFVFVNAPFESSPGPGVLPVFEGMGPYYRWRNSRGLKGHALPDKELEAWEADSRLVDEMLDKVLEDKDGTPFVGVLGFSQGAGLAARILMRQEQAENEDWSARHKLRFGVLICGTAECLYSWKRPSPSLGSESCKSTEKKQLIQTKSVHVHGLSDPWLPSSQTLLKDFFDPITSTLVEFNGGHHLPMSLTDTERLAEIILRTSE